MAFSAMSLRAAAMLVLRSTTTGGVVMTLSMDLSRMTAFPVLHPKPGDAKITD
jgi:hypothetical protein